MRLGRGIPGSAAGLLVARHEELELLRAQMTEATRGVPRFVLVQGQPGMGRTALIKRFVSDVNNACVLFGSGDDCETTLRYGVVEQLCRTRDGPLSSPLDLLEGGEAASNEPFIVGAALVEAIRDVNIRVPVVIAIDDAHLADVASQLSLLFALRRLQCERALTVLSVPTGGESLLPGGLLSLIRGDQGAVVTLEGLDDDEIRELSHQMVGRPVTRALAKRLREHTGGNPRHVRALLQERCLDFLASTEDVPLPVPVLYEVSVRTRLAPLSADALRLLGAAAVVGSPCDFGLARRVAGLNDPLVALESAVAARFIEYRDRRLFFPEPLVHAAVYHSLGIGERAELHGRAARFLDDEPGRLVHRAAAATEQDDELATDLAADARRRLGRRDPAGAASLFVTAARLSQAGAGRDAHLLDAVDCLLVGGDIAVAARMSRDLDRCADAARAHLLLGRMARLQGRHHDAERHLTRASELRAPGAAPELAAEIAGELAGSYVGLLRPADAATRAEVAVGDAGGSASPWSALPSLALGLVMTGRAEEAARRFAAFAEPVDDDREDAGALLLGRSIVRLYGGSLGEAHDDARRLARSKAAMGDRFLRVYGLALVAITAYRSGAWAEAVSQAQAAAELAEEADLGFCLSTAHAAAVWPATGLGRWEVAESHARQAAAAALGPWDLAMADMARAVVAHGRGRHDEVLAAIAQLRTRGAAGSIDEPDGFWPWQSLHVDALLASGRPLDAEASVERFEAQVAERASLTATMVAARLRARTELALGRESDAHVAFGRAVSLCSLVPAPFERALTQAAYGAFLRRIGKRSAAATALQHARDAFDRLGARPSVQRCERELAAGGLAPRKRRSVGAGTLTPQEGSVARLVAQGKTNRAVASELVVSVNTIEYHLKNIYAKLGMHSRSQLVLRLAAFGDNDGPGLPRGGTLK